jgi:adenylylsulfate kinase
VSFTVWFTGLSGSGKTTLSRMVEDMLRQSGLPTARLDGPELRSKPGWGLGFGRRDRSMHTLRLGGLARTLNDGGTICLVAAIAPYARARRTVRRMIGQFVEVYCQADLATLIAHDERGVYAMALSGEIKGFTGVSDPYEAPQLPEVTVHPFQETPEASARRVLSALGPLVRQWYPDKAWAWEWMWT